MGFSELLNFTVLAVSPTFIAQRFLLDITLPLHYRCSLSYDELMS